MKATLHAPAVPARTHKNENWRERDQMIEIIAIFKFVKAAGLIAIDFGLPSFWILPSPSGCKAGFSPYLKALLTPIFSKRWKL